MTRRFPFLTAATACLAVVCATVLLPACGPAGTGSLGPAPSVGAPVAGDTTSPQATKPATPPHPSPDTSSVPVRPSTSADPTGPGQPARGPVQPPPSSEADPGSPGKVHTFQVWFIRDGSLAVTTRSRPWTPAVAKLALTSLVAGPSSTERAAGVRSPIRTDTRFSISLARGVAAVELPASFFTGGRTLARQRQAQVVYTLTQYPTISSVEFRINGVGNAPVKRSTYADLLPAIVVAMPSIGSTVTSPVTVSGTANVFEATVSVRVLDASGGEIATTFTTASCGTGCRGSYSVPVTFSVGRTQPGTIQVYEVSAEDGSRTNLVDIPVTLSP